MNPVVAVVCDIKQQGAHLYHQAGDKYIEALRRCTDLTPVLVPSLSEPLAIEEIAGFADAMLFTGGYSNIERHHYGESPAPTNELQDPTRDKNTLHFIPKAIDLGMPILGICRGLQEINVALGGSLHPRLHEVPGRIDHQEDGDMPLNVQYGPSHRVTVKNGGMLEKIVSNKEFMVNSLHGQGINRVAEQLRIEATADDSTVEAVSVKSAKGFALAVQWHPEWLAWENAQSKAIFKAFSAAAHTFQREKGSR
ncbi:MAG: gamma-glutamyl-gamma-aminobutyrate hydrolase family protein [Kordiimonas sp.]